MPFVSLARAESLARAVLVRHRTSESNAASVARALVAAQADGQGGHGLSRLPAYAAQAASGKVDGRATPRVVDRRPAAARVDAAHGFAFPAMDAAFAVLREGAARNGVYTAAVFRSHHFGQAGYHVERLAAAGLAALAFTNSPRAIAPWGGGEGLFGTNPVAFAAPREGHAPLLVDLGLSRAARGKVMVAARRGEAIPRDWALDAHGRPTTDAQAALDGTMTPIGGAKGAALAMMVEVLAAALSGANFGFEASSFFDAAGKPPGVGHVVIAFDVEFFSGGAFGARLERLIEAMLAQPGVRLPGARRLESRARAAARGLQVDADLLRRLESLAGP